MITLSNIDASNYLIDDIEIEFGWKIWLQHKIHKHVYGEILLAQTYDGPKVYFEPGMTMNWILAATSGFLEKIVGLLSSLQSEIDEKNKNYVQEAQESEGE